MKLSKVALVLSSLSLISSAFAMTDSELATALRADAAKYLITIKVPRLAFHWVDASDITPPGQYKNRFPMVSSQYRDYVAKQGHKIFNKRDPRDSDVAGPGLYLASDPKITRGYGANKTFGLIVGVLKPGARIYVSTYSAVNMISSNIVAEISKRGCPSSDYTSILDTNDQSCTKIKQLLVGADLSFADGRFYSYGTSTMPGCSRIDAKRDMTPAKSGASLDGLDTFVAYTPNLFSNIYGVTYMTSAGSDAFGDQILAYLKGVKISNDVSKNLLSDAQLSDASIKTMSAAEQVQFSQKYILGCVK
jgi:hypothetical protein